MIINCTRKSSEKNCISTKYRRLTVFIATTNPHFFIFVCELCENVQKGKFSKSSASKMIYNPFRAILNSAPNPMTIYFLPHSHSHINNICKGNEKVAYI